MRAVAEHRHPDDVRILAGRIGHELLFFEKLQVRQMIAQFRRRFEFLVGGRLAHALFQERAHRIMIALEERQHPLDALLAILLRREFPNARRAAVADVEVETGRGTIAVGANHV